VKYPQSSFNAGELSPQMAGRSDLAKYNSGVQKCQNWIPLVHGPVTKRPGFEHRIRLKNHDKAARLYDFAYTADTAFVIEIGDLYMRFHTPDGQVVTEGPTDIEGATQANPVVITMTGHPYSNGDTIYIKEVRGMTELNGREFTVANAAANTIELSGEDGTGHTAYVSNGTVQQPTEITTTYTEAELDDLDFEYSGATIWIAHGDHRHAKLVYDASDGSWTLSDLPMEDGPWNLENTTSTTLTPSATTGSGITITASAVTGINNDQGFLSTDVDRLITIDHSGTWGVAVITAVGSTTSVTADVITDFGATTAQLGWRLGAWSDTEGWPKQVEFNNERLWWGKTDTWPLRLWGSAIGLYYTHTFQDTPAADDAIDVEIGGRQADEIQWLVSGSKFAVGTGRAEYWLAGGDGNGSITNTSRQVIAGSREGCGTTRPEMAGNTLLYMTRHNKALKELKYSFEEEAFTGQILTALAEHLTRDYTITEMAFQKDPWRVLWCRRSDGTLLGLTYYPEHEVFGWSVHVIAGEDADIERIAVIPGSTSDQLFAIVKRTINSSTVRYLERMDGQFTGSDTDDAHFLDSYLCLDNRQTVESISYADPGIISLTGHGYSNGDLVTFRRSDREFDSDTSLHYEDFYVVNKAANTFQVETSVGGGAIDLTNYEPDDDDVTHTVALKETVIYAADHLEGETVECCVDGAATTTYTVSAGSITLEDAGSVVCLGLKYEADLELWPPGFAENQRATVAETRRISGVIFQLFKAIGIKFGRSFSNLFDIPFLDNNTPLGRAVPLQNGLTKEWEMESGHDTATHTCIRSDQPYPATILAVYQEAEVEQD